MELGYEAHQAALCCLNNKTPYLRYKFICDCIVAKMKKGKTIDLEHLAKSSSVSRLCKLSFDECKDYINPTKESRDEFKHWIAEYMIKEATYEANRNV